MEEALLKNEVVSAKSIAELSGDVLAGLRTRFKCKACKVDAYFNRGSPKQAPYFAAKHHGEGCQEAYYGARDQDQKLVEAGTVVIPIAATVLTSDQGQTRALQSPPRSRTSVSGTDGAANTSATRGVSAVLNELINRPEFAKSSKFVVVGASKTPASEFFVPFLQLSDKHADRTIGVWGTVFAAKEGGSIVWLNRGDQKVSIQVPKSVFQELKMIYKFTSVEELTGAKFLLVGTFNIFLECRISDVKQLALQVTKVTN